MFKSKIYDMLIKGNFVIGETTKNVFFRNIEEVDIFQFCLLTNFIYLQKGY